ncbi:YfhO family protein [Tundrisphaera lichenicola]|uniref:YfhO family protein n=1 Tax=Tundrisphaera lichenicola TaxID=2029860 RepID=UPI003EBA8467
MRRFSAWIGLACGLALLLYVYRPVLFFGETYGFRDAAHFYYPLYERVQDEWNAGRWPLWDADENAGMPLLGNPTAAVLYPGKLIFGMMSYPWAARLYAVAHTALAFAGMLALIRAWGTSRTGASIAGLSYAFGAPILFQYCNIIFLVGAAWTPWGFLAVDGWLRRGRRIALGGLAVVLAMQVLGGEPESAYLIGLCAGAYAIILSRTGEARRRSWGSRTVWLGLILLGIAAWVAITLGLAAILPGLRPEPGEGPWGAFGRWFSTGRLPSFRKAAFEGPVPSFPWASWLPAAVAGAWGLVGLTLFVRWRKRGSSSVPLVPKLAGLAAAAILAGSLSAAQLLPVVEFTGLSNRATDEGAHDIYPFSLEPYRLVEAVWPGAFGRSFGQPVMWSEMLVRGMSHRVWVPSLYLGGLTLLLAFGAAGFRDGPPWRGWLTGIAAVSLVGSFGEYASPIALARFSPSMVEVIGPHDSVNTNAVRLDGYLRDGDGSPYCLMAALLPGFHTFRFPSKLLSFTVLAVAALAGIGWDRVLEGRSRNLGRIAVLGSGSTLVVLAVMSWYRAPFVQWLGSVGHMTVFGPLDSVRALSDTQMALIHGALILLASGGLIPLARRKAELAGGMALILLAVDLGLANAPLILTVPQKDLEATPRVLQIIREAERDDPSPGPYRIHRAPIWNPTRWRNEASDDRVRDFVRWELDTIQPKYGLLHDVEYTYSIGVAELYDFSWFFAPFPRTVRSDAARMLGIKPGETIVVYPRRGFDLWNSRYFVLPGLPAWDDADRGIAAFLPRTETIYPPKEFLRGKQDDPEIKNWAEAEDFQILKNLDAYPRAWIVHKMRHKPPITGLTRGTRKETMEEILFDNDLFWNDPARPRFDPKDLAWIEAEPADREELNRFLPGTSLQAGESVRVMEAESNPQRVVIEAKLAQPGLVILADVYYPGWTLTIDDKPSPILRANRAMRGAAVPEGTHRLVYTYYPKSFRIGGLVSLGGIAALVGFLGWNLRSGRTRRG